MGDSIPDDEPFTEPPQGSVDFEWWFDHLHEFAEAQTVIAAHVQTSLTSALLEAEELATLREAIEILDTLDKRMREVVLEEPESEGEPEDA